MARGTHITVDGPYPGGIDEWSGDEYEVYSVFVADDEGEPVGKVYECRTRTRAFNLAQKMGDDRNLPIEYDCWV